MSGCRWRAWEWTGAGDGWISVAESREIVEIIAPTYRRRKGRDENPAFSPDDRHTVFSSDRATGEGSINPTLDDELFIINTDGASKPRSDYRERGDGSHP